MCFPPSTSYKGPGKGWGGRRSGGVRALASTVGRRMPRSTGLSSKVMGITPKKGG